MIFQNIIWSRIFIILTTQPIISIIFLLLAYRILKRRTTNITLILSIFYILVGIGFIFDVIYLLLTTIWTTQFLSIFYFITYYLIIFPEILIVIFIKNILKIELFSSFKKDLIIIIFYGILGFMLHMLPGGITVNKETNWTPVFSWAYLILLYIYFTIMVFIPTMIFSVKLYNKFEDKNLKKKLKFFIIGIISIFTTLYGAALFNTWQNPIFKTIWSVLSLILTIPSGFLIYYGIGQNL